RHEHGPRLQSRARRAPELPRRPGHRDLRPGTLPRGPARPGGDRGPGRVRLAPVGGRGLYSARSKRSESSADESAAPARLERRPGSSTAMELRNLEEIGQAVAALAAGNGEALDRLVWTGVFGAGEVQDAARAAVLDQAR